MEFILNEYHRNISNDDLLHDMKRVAQALGRDTLSQDDYKTYGKYGCTTYRRRFGGWNKALTLCGLTPNTMQLAAAQSNPQSQNIPEEELLSDVRNVALRLGKDTISSGEYKKYGQYSKDTCFKRFDTWEKTLEKAGLKKYVQVSEKRIEDDLLLEEIERLWIQLGRQPTATDIKSGLSKYTLNTYSRHFGGWRGALDAFINWVNADKNEQNSVSNDSGKHQASEKSIQQYVPEEAYINTKPPQSIHSTTRDINLRLRFVVMQRDNFKCRFCGASPAKDPSVELHVDHIKPWAKGGETVIENLQTLCSKCNLGKSDLIIG